MIYFIDNKTGEKLETKFKSLDGIAEHNAPITEKLILKTDDVLILYVLGNELYIWKEEK